MDNENVAGIAGFTLPSVQTLENFAAEADHIVGTAENLLQDVEKYAADIPFIGQYTGALEGLVKALAVAKSLLDHVPGANK